MNKLEKLTIEQLYRKMHYWFRKANKPPYGDEEANKIYNQIVAEINHRKKG